MPRQLGYNPTKYADKQFNKRVIRLMIALFGLVLILATRLFYLQIQQHHYYLDQEERNRSNLLAIEPRRGIITDRNGVVLANDITVYSLVVQRDKVKDLKQTLAQLQELLGISAKEIQVFLKDVKNHPRFAPIPLVDRLTEEQTAKFMLNQYRFPGVSAEVTYIRHYPLGAAMAPVTGYVSRINEKELQLVDPANYGASTNIGKIGVEKYFEKDLHGQIGYQRIAMDALGRKTKELSNIPPIPGNNLTLTIDSQLQEAAYKAFNGSRGALVVIQPSTGQILALVSSPSYDPNLFVSGIDSKTYNALQKDPYQPLFNRAIRGQFPFGSTIKPFYALQGLETGAITPSTNVYDPGYFTLPGVKHVWHNWTWNVKHGGQGNVNVTRALEQSNDTFFFTLAIKMGIDKMADILNQFGFGKKTNIEMLEESTGHIGTPAWKQAKKHEKWYAGDTVSAGIGQGYVTMTITQLAQGISMIANRGQQHKPTLLLQEQTPDGKTRPYVSPMLPEVKLKSQTWDVVINGLQRVIDVGTGSYHFGQKEFGKPKYTAAGKTGTAQVYNYKGVKYSKSKTPIDLRDNSLFEVFAPVDNPQIAVAIVNEHEENAGLIARQVVDFYLQKQEAANAKQTQPTAATPKDSDAAAEEHPDADLAEDDSDEDDEE
jgi:penicillin-binding protein 2